MNRLRSPETGFTLIETLVALVVLSIGLLGIAALYVEGLGATRTAQFRTQAVNLVSDMADRIRANPTAGAAYAGAAADNGCDSVGGNVAVDCTPAEMAAHDLYRWQAEVDSALPQGSATVTVNPGTVPATYTITVRWTEAGDGGANYQLTVRI